MEVDLLRLILAALTCFRLAQLITLDKGPWLIFERLRQLGEREAASHNNHFINKR